MKSAILIIDVQSILFGPVPRPFEEVLVVERINHVTSWANGVVVIHAA